jgi:glycine cleavage system H protein
MSEHVTQQPRRYTRDHEWVTVHGDLATMGISRFAAEQLGDVVFVELPETGKQLKKGDDLAVVESVKAASDVYAPLSGEVVDANATLEDAPETVNAMPEGEGWICVIRIADGSELDALMDEDAYLKFCEEEAS